MTHDDPPDYRSEQRIAELEYLLLRRQHDFASMIAAIIKQYGTNGELRIAEENLYRVSPNVAITRYDDMEEHEIVLGSVEGKYNG